MKTGAVKILSPAKVNLFLEVLGKRPDGFHEVKTVLQGVSLYDELHIRRVPKGISISSDCPDIPLDGKNLVHRAAAAFLRNNRIKSGVHIDLIKRIPVAGGMGGGSSNAACTLLALNKLFGHPWGSQEISSAAESLGSDVPFFMRGSPSVGIGKGGEIIVLEKYVSLWILLAAPRGLVLKNKTAQIYKGLKIALTKNKRPITITLVAIETNNVKLLCDSLFNRLERVVFCQMAQTRSIKAFMLVHGAMGALVSGAGPAVFGVVSDRIAGRKLEQKIHRQFGEGVWTRLVRTIPATPSAQAF